MRRFRSILAHGHAKGWLWFLGSLAWGVWEIVHDIPDFTALSWKELAIRVSKAVPAVLTSIFGRGILFGYMSKSEESHNEDAD